MKISLARKPDNAPAEQSNRLPVLALKINTAHASVKHHIKATIAEMMTAGDDLREAKNLAGHGKWLSWLRTNCPDVSERTAHLYMQFAKWRSVVEEAMAKSAMVADLERDQLKVPMGLAVGPFGVVDAIAAIHEAEHHENTVKENRLKLAALAAGEPLKPPPPAWSVHEPLRGPRGPRQGEMNLALEMESFSNWIKCCLSQLSTDQYQRREFLKQARSILDAVEAEQLTDRQSDVSAMHKLHPSQVNALIMTKNRGAA